MLLSGTHPPRHENRRRGGPLAPCLLLHLRRKGTMHGTEKARNGNHTLWIRQQRPDAYLAGRKATSSQPNDFLPV